MPFFRKIFSKLGIAEFGSPESKRKKPDTGANDDAEPPQKRPSAGEAPQQTAAAAATLPGKMSQPSANPFVTFPPRVWMERLPAPGSATRTQGGRRPASPRCGPAPPPASLTKASLKKCICRQWLGLF